MRKLLFLLIMFLSVHAYSQKLKAPGKAPVIEKTAISKAGLQKLKLYEDTLHRLSNAFMDDTIAANRKKACYAFIPTLVRALKTENSFYYHFDSLETVNMVYPPDSTFRIFTWQLYFTRKLILPAASSKTGRDTFFEKPAIRYFGVIQMRSKELKIYPLYDAGDTLTYGSQQVLGTENWWGQIYYNVIQKTANGKNYYTLFGYEVADALTRRKILDILTFDNMGKPHFGAALFYFKYNDTLSDKKYDTLSRFFMEYKFDAATVLNFDPELDMIVFDHVAPPSDKAKGCTFTYVPDGTYEGFIWSTDNWQWVEKVFTFAINQDDNPPIPVPLFGKPKQQPELPKEGDPR